MAGMRRGDVSALTAAAVPIDAQVPSRLAQSRGVGASSTRAPKSSSPQPYGEPPAVR